MLPQVLLARSERLQSDFNEQLRRRAVTKECAALVTAALPFLHSPRCAALTPLAPPAACL